jgi:hypothetical protein
MSCVNFLPQSFNFEENDEVKYELHVKWGLLDR